MKEKTRKIIRIILIVVIVVVFLAGLILTKQINKNYNTDNFDKSQYVILGSGEHKTFTTRSVIGTFSVPIAFAPNNTEAWGLTNEGCKYNVQAVNQAGYCINKGWDNVEYDLSTGISISPFDFVKNGIGYVLIKINVPKDLQPCVQRFIIEVRCNAYPLEYTKDYFDLEII